MPPLTGHPLVWLEQHVRLRFRRGRFRFLGNILMVGGVIANFMIAHSIEPDWFFPGGLMALGIESLARPEMMLEIQAIAVIGDS